MKCLNNEKAKLIIGGRGQACWGEQRANQRTPDGKCIFDQYCVPTNKYGKPDYSAAKKHTGVAFYSCNT
ncbi:hypothetical protein GWZ95_24380 [Escherichia coli]|uniref:hypothetical protein n=1 Tax=Escherichia coli TaxID=562 RepID=UPI0012FF66E4|nr:hypothetical protein [Escherichia coli]EFI5570563.1 hypothetical protein [Escherichia coli]